MAKLIETSINVANQILAITVAGEGTLNLSMKDVSPACATYAMLHGFKQRICDAAALSRDETTGASATPADKYAAMERLVQHYASGAESWSLAERAAGGAPSEGLTIAAMKRVWPDRNADELIAGIMTKRGVERRAALKLFADSDKVAAAIATIKAERAAVNADDLIEELT